MPLLPIVIAAGVWCAASPAAVQAGPDPCTGVGTVTCSGDQSAGVENPPPGTTVLNVNSLTGNIAPTAASGRPGILFFGAGDITLTSATSPFGIIMSGDFVDGIVAAIGGAIKATVSGNISIRGIFADGINLLSFAGGAINLTSSSNISLANGGDGIDVYSDGTVAVTSSGIISVAGEGTGITASAGNHVTVTSSGPISVGDGDAIDASDIGGPSGKGGVNVTSSGAISLAGNLAVGIDADSYDTDEVSVRSSSNISLADGGVAILADGLGAVTVNSSGAISIAGSSAAGIAAASGPAGSVNITSSGNISITGDGAAIVAVSLGRAANVVSSGNISLGGSGIGIGAFGNTAATVNSSGGISVGGGGNAITAVSLNGSADVTSSGSVSIKGNGTAIAAVSTLGAADITASGSIFIGSGTGIAAQGKLVQVDSLGNIAIAKGGTGIAASGVNGAVANSSGVTSIGGNGTAIAAASMGGAADVTSSGNISIGGSGTGIAAQGKLAEVDSSGNISLANLGTGIAASGGNGAVVNSSGVISIAGNGTAIAAASTGGAADITSLGNITISSSGIGIAAVGKVVQVNSSSAIAVADGGIGISASGGSGATVNSSGLISVGGSGTGISAKGGLVDINSSADVMAPGNAAVGIGAAASGQDIAIRIAGGTITGGSGTGAGVVLAGGASNTLTNFGTVTTSSGLAGTAILGMPIPGGPPSAPTVIGNNIVNNSGIVIGNLNLGPGRNAFNNLPGATFNTGASVNLGAGNSLSNSGNLSPGGSGVIQTTAVTGNLVQGGAGTISIDLNPATSHADRITVSGSANLGGQITLALANATPTTGATSLTLVHAAGGVTDNGLTLGALPAVAVYQLEFPDPSDLVVEGGLNFAPAGLNGNQNSVGQNINAIQLAGGASSFQPIVQAILTIPDVSSLGQAYDQLSPETYADNEIGDFYSGLRFANSLMSCNVPDGRYAFIKEGQCVWAQIGGQFLNLDATSGSLGFSESGVVVSGGAEVMLRPDWFASFALGYDHGSTGTGDTLAQSQTNRAHFGAAIKYNPGPFLLAAAVYGGYGWYTTDRYINFGDFNATASSDSLISRVGGQFRAAYLVDRGSWYLKPIVDLNVTRVNLNGFGEQGAGGADLIVSGGGQTVFSASPAVEIGTQRSLQNGALLRPFAQLGMTAFSNTDFAVSAAFEGAPAGTAPFGVATGIDSVTADVAAGADLFLPDSRWALKLAYSGHYGARVREEGVRLKASLRF